MNSRTAQLQSAWWALHLMLQAREREAQKTDSTVEQELELDKAFTAAATALAQIEKNDLLLSDLRKLFVDKQVSSFRQLFWRVDSVLNPKKRKLSGSRETNS